LDFELSVMAFSVFDEERLISCKDSSVFFDFGWVFSFFVNTTFDGFATGILLASANY